MVSMAVYNYWLDKIVFNLGGSYSLKVKLYITDNLPLELKSC